jgi:hypothetical protein
MNKTIYKLMSVILSLVLMLGSVTSASASSTSVGMRASSAALVVNTYYVKPTGSDANVGSSASPFKTLAKGISVLAAGDTLIVSGTFNETLNASKSGSATARIYLVGQGAVIDTNASMGIAITGSYINVSGFEITHVRQHALWNVGKHNIIENNVVHDSVTENGTNGNCTLITAGGWASGISIKLGSDDVLVRNNTVYHNCGEGIAATRASNTIIENNVSYDNFSLNIYVDNSFFLTVRNNTVNCSDYVLRNGHRSVGIGTAAESYSGWGMQLHDVSILGNTVTGCYDNIMSGVSSVGGTAQNILIDGNSLPSGTRYAITNRAVVQNMVISNNQIHSGGISLNPSAGVTLSNNTLGSTSTQTATPTSALTSIPPTATKTATSLPASPTATPTRVLPTATQQATNPPATPTLTLSTPTAIPGGPASLSLRVSNGSDDAEEGAKGWMYLDSTDLELVVDADKQLVGLRFNGVNIPRNATITKATIQFKVDETTSAVTVLTIQGEASPNAAAFTIADRNISSRSRTSAAVTWMPSAWLKLNAAGAAQQTPNLALVIQQIVNQPGWAAGNSLVLIITGNGKRVAKAFEVDSAGAPLLYIEYTVP